jgi:dihydropyrimidine dehydrogenase (NADP+)
MASLNLTQVRGKNFVPAEFARTRPSWNRPSRVGFKVFASKSQAEPDLSVTVNGLHMPNQFVIGSGPPGTNYTVMKRAFDEGWGAVIAKTVRLSLLIGFALFLVLLEKL